jgi:hypothetical protein
MSTQMSTQMSIQTQFEVNQELSLYIPHVFLNFTSEYITDVFEFMELGEVKSIDLVAKMDKNGKQYNAAYIHFSEWFTGPVVENFQERVLDPNREARIIHDDPWYWIILENTAKKYVPGARKECIDLSESIENVIGIKQNIPIACGLQDLQNNLLSNINLFCGTDHNYNYDLVCKENVMLKKINSIHLVHEKEYYEMITTLCLKMDELTRKIEG